MNGNFQRWWDRFTAALIFGVLTAFVLLDFFPEERIDNELVFGAWAAYSTVIATWMARRRDR